MSWIDSPEAALLFAAAVVTATVLMSAAWLRLRANGVSGVEPPARAPDFVQAGFVGRLDALLRGRTTLDEAALAQVESLLFGADLGVRTAEEFMQVVRAESSADQIRPALERRAREILDSVSASPSEDAKPHVVLMVGVNGSGKTTSIGKLAGRWTAQGKRVLLAAGDTFRAAAIDQLRIWAERAGAEFVHGEPGGDPAAIAFDAVESGVARGFDVVVIDTAGRMQTDAGLMDEVGKIVRVIRKQLPEAPHEVLLALDANTGQNAIRQAQEFARAVDVTSIVLSKLDGSAKGGVVLGIARELGIPVRYVGMGEQIGDLYDFDAEAFAKALFAPPTDAPIDAPTDAP